ncbi:MULTISPECIES: hypothetical protein [Bacillus cereus group]|uniref:hypothetical protein n=1 Tax=Bacillus cereus group TaxID=86661 RepID=UPI0024BD4292|nr:MULTISPECIES: hypothetical protein [Bacillus cereus group]
MSGKRRVLTWTLNAGNTAYEEDLEKYGNKIYALGVHEVQVEKTGECYIRRDIPSSYDGTDYGEYRYGNGLKIDKTTDFDLTRGFWKKIEGGMRRWPHINHYLSFILFGVTRVVPMLDNQNNAQQVLIDRIKATLDHFATSPNFPNDPNNMKYIKGIEIDFEASFSDHIYDYREGDNLKFMNILKRIKNEICIPRGLVLQVNAYAMWGKDTPYYYRFHDYEMFANTADQNGNSVIDELQIMSYDFHWNGSAPGASTPLWWLENVGGWAKQCFGSPNAKLKIDNIFFGSAGYGHRWGVWDPNRMTGSTITYRNFLDWQNGLYRHNRGNGDGSYTWHDQDFLMQAGFEDPESKNEILHQHIYDYFKARYGESTIVNGAKTTRLAEYNGLEYATTYSRVQQAKFTNIQDYTFTAAAVYGNKGKVNSVADIEGSDITLNNNGQITTLRGIRGYKVYPSDWIPATEEGVGTYCKKDPSGRVHYYINAPRAGVFRLVALVSFVWYTSAKLGGTWNGNPITIQAPADYYPLHFKASHWFDLGYMACNAGKNEIIIDGDKGDPGSIIYGFVLADEFEHRFRGGEMSFRSTVKPMKRKDGQPSRLPSSLSVTAKALRQTARPLIMWDDRFAQYLKDKGATANLTSSLYYAAQETKTAKGNGQTLSDDKTYCYDPGNPTYSTGYSWGTWKVSDDGGKDSAHVLWNDPNKGGRLLLNYGFQSNIQIECELSLKQDGIAGLVFGGTGQYDGYCFTINRFKRRLELSLNEQIIDYDPLPDNFNLGDRTKLRAIFHNGKAYFYLGYSGIKAFRGRVFDLPRTSGGICGLYAQSVIARYYVFTVSTTDKWDLMEKFEVEVDGQRKVFGAIPRSNHTIDPNFGYLNYSGLDERNDTRDKLPDGTAPSIPLDYEFFITNISGFEGTKDIKVTLLDAGIWFNYLYVVDAEGGSVTWVGDAYSFIDSMNRAVDVYGAKGIGLWTMGQEDPRVFEMIPDVVPYHK